MFNCRLNSDVYEYSSSCIAEMIFCYYIHVPLLDLSTAYTEIGFCLARMNRKMYCADEFVYACALVCVYLSLFAVCLMPTILIVF